MKRSNASTSMSRPQQRASAPRWSAACGTRRTRSSRAATCAGGARRCARSRRRSCRSRSRAGAAARRRASRPARTCAGSCAGIRRHELRRQAERLGVERRVALGLGAERVELRGEVAVRAVRLEQRGRGLDGLQQLLVDLRRRGGGRRRRGSRAAAAAAAGAGRRGRRRRASRRARAKTPLVEAVLALQVGLDDLQEPARLGALDDAVVVGRGHRHDLLGADHRRRSAPRPTG